METTLSTRTSSLGPTMLLSMTSEPPGPTVTGPHLAARSAITLYPPAGGDATSTLTEATGATQAASANQNTQQTNSSSSASPKISPAAFWAVLSCLIVLLLLLALAFPLWYCLRGRHKNRSSSYPFSTPSSTNNTLDGQEQPSQTISPVSWLFPSLTNPHQQHGPSPFTPHQQIQLLKQLTQPSAEQITPSSRANADPNKAALLARLAALNNPSILNGIPEDSTVLTSSSLHPRPPAVNSNYRVMAEKKLAELRAKGAVVEDEDDDDEGGGGGGAGEGGKKVRFKAQEWAVLGSEVDSVGPVGARGPVDGKVQMKVEELNGGK